jgi:murein DD-endopeptidase MepM/ murein hydrolase activator NlpD
LRTRGWSHAPRWRGYFAPGEGDRGMAGGQRPAGERRLGSQRREGGSAAAGWPLWAQQCIVCGAALALLLVYLRAGLPGHGWLRTGVGYVLDADYDAVALARRLPSLRQIQAASGSGLLSRLWGQGGDGKTSDGTTDTSGQGAGTGAGTGASGRVLRLARPVLGEPTSLFGVRIDPISKKEERHEGVDFKANSGDPIIAPMDGRVTKVGFDQAGYGKWLEIDHGGGVSTLYAHCLEILVKEKELISQGQVIARVGQSGAAVGPHLHFEVRRNGQAVDPVPILGIGQGG